MEKFIKCPIDGHNCGRIPCRLFPTEPQCIDAAQFHADDHAFLIEIDQAVVDDISVEKKKAKGRIWTTSAQLGIDYNAFQSAVDKNIENFDSPL